MSEDSGVITRSYPSFISRKTPPPSHHFFIPCPGIPPCDLFFCHMHSFTHSLISLHTTSPLNSINTQSHKFSVSCLTLVFFLLLLCHGLIWQVVWFKFFICSLLTSQSQLCKQRQIVQLVIVMSQALQYPSNVPIPLCLSGHWQINNLSRVYSQTFLSHSQPFHISSVTSAMQPLKLLYCLSL